MKVVFGGSTDYSRVTLDGICKSRHEAVLVVSRPDRPKGRGRKLRRTPLAEFALSKGLSLFQPESVNSPESIERLRAAAPDVIVTAAFGQILKSAVLGLPRRGCINSHASLLPKFRGAAPIPAAIMAGDAKTGVTIFRMGEGLDDGLVILAREEEILPDDTTGSLTARLAGLSAEAVVAALDLIEEGRAEFQEQDGTLATFAPKLRGRDSLLRWDAASSEIERRVRAFSPEPGAFTHYLEKGRKVRLEILRCAPASDAAGSEALPPGTIVKGKDDFAVRTGDGWLCVLSVKKEGKSGMDAAAFLRGARMDEYRFLE